MSLKNNVNMRGRLVFFNLLLVIFILLYSNYSVFAESIDDKLDISAQSSILIDQDSGKVLYEKDKDEQMYPASTTKCMTALIVLENCPLDDIVTVGNEIDMISYDASKAGLVKGESISVKDMLMGLMLPSGNDAAYAAAVYTARKVNNNNSLSIDESLRYFVDMMNKKAVQLGAESTNFENVDGYHNDNHYTTADDLALIVQAAMNNSTFREIVSTVEYKSENKIGSNNSKSITHKWTNKNELIIKDSKNYISQATGVKTGYTTPAGYCLTAGASKDGMNLIAVVLKSNSDADRWKDAKSVINYGLQNYQKYKLCGKNDTIDTVKVAKFKIGKRAILNAVSQDDISIVLNNEDINSIQRNIVWDEKKVLIKGNDKQPVVLHGPILKDTHIGTVTYTLNGETIAKTELVSQSNTMKKSVFDIFVYMVDSPSHIFISIVLIFIILSIAAKLKKNKRLRNKKENEKETL